MSENIGQGTERKICFNCGEEKIGELLPNPSERDKEKLVWICPECFHSWYIN